MWTLDFISEDDFKFHVQATIEKYLDGMISYDLKTFNRNLIDPIKLLFDKAVYGYSWEDVVKTEIARQRDKASNNDIGYFHQRLFRYIDGCTVPDNGAQGGWDIIFRKEEGIPIPNAGTVHTVYVEMKNKHNTMNNAAAGKTYIKMQNQLLHDDDCACFLVEVIAKKSQNIVWNPTVDGSKVSHRLIRRVSIDQFMSIVTGQEDSFYQLCMVLPEKVKEVIDGMDANKLPNDTAFDELKALASKQKVSNEELAFTIAAYLLGFSSYVGFKE